METSKSPRRILQSALRVAQGAMRRYSHRFSPKKFTQHQLFACLVLKESFKLDYRGVTRLLADAGDLREAIDLRKVPHFTTLQKASVRLFKRRRVQRLLDETIHLARQRKLLGRRIEMGAMDSSGFETRHASSYYVKRRESARKSQRNKPKTWRHFPKLGILCDCRSHFVLAAVAEQGPRPDFGEVDPLVNQAQRRGHLGTLLADAGYDAEWVHRFLRLVFGTRTVIPACHGRPSNKMPSGHYRRLMRSRFNKTRYGQRAQVETVFSMIKRRLEECVTARSYWGRCRDLLLKVLSHNILLLAILRQLFYRADECLF